MSKTNNLGLSIPEMKAAIVNWNGVKQLNEGYKYMVSGISLEVYKEDYQKWKVKTDFVYCHLGVHKEVHRENEKGVLIFIFALESDPSKLAEATTFAVPFYNDILLSSNGNNNSLTSFNARITSEKAGNHILNWTIYSDIWFKNEINYKQQIVEYIKIESDDFQKLFNQKGVYIDTVVGFFGLRETTEVRGLENEKDPRVVTSLIFGSKPLSPANDANPIPSTPIYTDTTRPIPPFDA